MISEPCYAVTARSEVLRLRNTLNKKRLRTVILTQAQYAYNKLLSFIGTLVFLLVCLFCTLFVYPFRETPRETRKNTGSHTGKLQSLTEKR